MSRTLPIAFSLCWVISSLAYGQDANPLYEIPVRYDEHRFLAQPITEQGDTLTFMIDSGISGFFMYRNEAERIGLELETIEFGGVEATRTAFPNFKPGASIPPALSMPYAESRQIIVTTYEPFYAVEGDTTSPNVKAGWSGLLGAPWLYGRVWTFDYAQGKLFLREDGLLPEHSSSDVTELEFNHDQHTTVRHYMTRIQAEIDGEEVHLFFDTGASMYVSEDVLAALSDGRAAVRESSFIRQSLIDRWRSRHPDWRYFEKGANGRAADLIEVPTMKIAGHTIGPVWFLSGGRDQQWEGFFSDKKTDGALGGSALKYFTRVTVDYNRGIAVFEK